MANVQDYQNQAASIYDPQLQAELEQVAQKKRGALTALGEEEKSIEPEYQRALRGVGEQIREGEGKINQLYSQRLGGQFSGLQGNDMGMMYSKANQNRTDIETARAGKLSGIASRRTLAEQEEASTGSALRSKYGGLKSQYAQEAYQQALQAEQEQNRWNQEIALKRQESARSSQAAAKPSAQQEVLSAFAQLGSQKMATEKVIIPMIMSEYGLTKQQAADLVYPLRKQVLGF